MVWRDLNTFKERQKAIFHKRMQTEKCIDENDN